MTLPLLDAGRYRVAGGGSLDSDASAFIARITSTPDSTRQALYNDFFVSIKANIGLAKFDGIWLFAAADTQSALLNLVSTNYNCTAENTPSFTTDRGYNGAGANGRLNTNFNPSSAAGRVFGQNTCCVSGWSLTSTGLDTCLWGQASSSNIAITPRGTDNTLYAGLNNTSNNTIASQTDGSGLYVTSRSASTGYTVYRNGSSIGAITATSTTVNNSMFTYLDASGFASWTGRIACGSIGGALTGAEVSSLYTAFQAYLQGVGAV